MAEADLELDRIVSVEGPPRLVPGLVGDPDWEPEVLARLRQVETEPSLYRASGHLLTVARRPTG